MIRHYRCDRKVESLVLDPLYNILLSLNRSRVTECIRRLSRTNAHILEQHVPNQPQNQILYRYQAHFCTTGEVREPLVSQLVVTVSHSLHRVHTLTSTTEDAQAFHGSTTMFLSRSQHSRMIKTQTFHSLRQDYP